MMIAVTVERDGADERKGTYRLRTSLSLSGPLTPAQREELLAVAGKCPVHKLMAQATTESRHRIGQRMGTVPGEHESNPRRPSDNGDPPRAGVAVQLRIKDR